VKKRGLILGVSAALLAVMVAGNGARAGVAVPVLKPSSERVYFVMLDRFSNGNPANDSGGYGGGSAQSGFDPANNGYFHGGDIDGLIAKIPYIKSLGFTSIWVTPVVRQLPVASDGSSAAYHGYWGVGFDQVDPHWGTMKTFQDLVSTAHQQGIKIILDIVINHTADVIHYADGTTYISGDQSPYRDAKGRVFDAGRVAGTSKFPALSLAKSFPKSPFVYQMYKSIKSPAWLNDLRNYHNRGDSSFSGESSQWGDFYGLDDLFTESPVVVKGMIALWSKWITDTSLDGFRIDTARHVNPEFWKAFIPAIQRAALAKGKTSFPIWGEIFDTDPLNTSWWVVNGGLPSVLDFPLQDRIYNFITRGATNPLTMLFNNDDYYTTATSSAAALGTFLSNHDMGRIGGMLNSRDQTPEVVLKQDELAHAMLFALRGSPIVYYGDEVGMTGGNDKNARQDMFPTLVASWQTEPRVGGNPIGRGNSFGVANPLKDLITSLNGLRAANPAFSSGSQWVRFARDGVLVISRFDPTSRTEYLAAFNSSDTNSVTDIHSVSTPNAKWSAILGMGTSVSHGAGATISLPAYGWGMFKADRSLPLAGTPSVTFNRVSIDAGVTDRISLSAKVAGADPASVAFYAQLTGSKSWLRLGTDTNRSFVNAGNEGNLFRVLPPTARFKTGSTITFRVIATSSSGATSTSKIQKFKVPK
jgi:glycosidase